MANIIKDSQATLLSHNTCVRTNEDGVEFNKISSSANTTMKLTHKEWFAIAINLREISSKVKGFADLIFENVQAGTPLDLMDFQNYERIISDKVAVGVSVFKPQSRHFISISIRSYFHRPDGKLIFRKYPGITLNQEEFISLKCQASQINQFISTLAATHDMHMGYMRQYQECSICQSVEEYNRNFQLMEETGKVGSKNEFNVTCRDPTDSIPAYRRIHEFIRSAKAGTKLVVTIAKTYDNDDFTIGHLSDTTRDQPETKQPESKKCKRRLDFGGNSRRREEEEEEEEGEKKTAKRRLRFVDDSEKEEEKEGEERDNNSPLAKRIKRVDTPLPPLTGPTDPFMPFNGPTKPTSPLFLLPTPRSLARPADLEAAATAADFFMAGYNGEGRDYGDDDDNGDLATAAVAADFLMSGYLADSEEQGHSGDNELQINDNASTGFDYPLSKIHDATLDKTKMISEESFLEGLRPETQDHVFHSAPPASPNSTVDYIKIELPLPRCSSPM